MKRLNKTVALGALVKEQDDQVKRITKKTPAQWEQLYRTRLLKDLARGKVTSSKVMGERTCMKLANYYGLEAEDFEITYVPLSEFQTWNPGYEPRPSKDGRVASQVRAFRLKPSVEAFLKGKTFERPSAASDLSRQMAQDMVNSYLVRWPQDKKLENLLIELLAERWTPLCYYRAIAGAVSITERQGEDFHRQPVLWLATLMKKHGWKGLSWKADRVQVQGIKFKQEHQGSTRPPGPWQAPPEPPAHTAPDPLVEKAKKGQEKWDLFMGDTGHKDQG